MKPADLDFNFVRRKIKTILISVLSLEVRDPEEIGDNDLLFGGYLATDSVVAIQILAAIESHFRIQVQDDLITHESFRDVCALSAMVKEQLRRSCEP